MCQVLEVAEGTIPTREAPAALKRWLANNKALCGTTMELWALESIALNVALNIMVSKAIGSKVGAGQSLSAVSFGMVDGVGGGMFVLAQPWEPGMASSMIVGAVIL